MSLVTNLRNWRAVSGVGESQTPTVLNRETAARIKETKIGWFHCIRDVRKSYECAGHGILVILNQFEVRRLH